MEHKKIICKDKKEKIELILRIKLKILFEW